MILHFQKILFSALLAIHSFFLPRSAILGGATMQTTAEDSAITDAENYQNNQYQTKGQYIHIPPTAFTATYPSTYEVNEMVYPDGTRGYQVITKHYEDIQILNATTSKMDTVSVLKQRSVGVGEESQLNTYEK